MGQLFSRFMRPAAPPAEPPKQEYSWDKRRREQGAFDFMIKEKNGETVVRRPGSINGEQIIISNCNDSNIYLFDVTATVTIDECKNCQFFIAPSKGSVFIRNSFDCKAVIACQQFRTRDCRNIHVSLCCATLPIIESTVNINFCCFQANYFELPGQFTAASTSPYNNYWFRIHDFTPLKEDPNWHLHRYEQGEHPAWLSKFFETGPQSEITVDTLPDNSAVPLTLAPVNRRTSNSCLVVLFPPTTMSIKKFLKALRSSSQLSVSIVRSREMSLRPDDCKRAFIACDPAALAGFSQAVKDGPVIGFELNGEGCIDAARLACENLKNPVALISDENGSPMKEIDAFFQVNDPSNSV